MKMAKKHCGDASIKQQDAVTRQQKYDAFPALCNTDCFDHIFTEPLKPNDAVVFFEIFIFQALSVWSGRGPADAGALLA